MNGKYLSYILNIVLMAGIVLFVKYCQPEPIEPKVIIEYVEVETPQINDSIPFDEREFIPIENSKEVDSTWYIKYTELKEKVDRDSLFREAIKINEYTETYEDENVKIDVYSKTRGELLNQSIPDYIVKPKTVTVPQTTIIKKEPPKINLYGGLELGNPLDGTLDPILKATGYIQGKKGGMISIAIDTKKNGFIGKIWKF